MKVTIEIDYYDYCLLYFLLSKRSEEMQRMAQETECEKAAIFYEKENDLAKTLKRKIQISYFKLKK